MKQKRWLQGDKDRKGGCSRRETKTEKVVVAEIVGKEIQRERQRKEKRGKRGEDGEEGRSFSESLEKKSLGGTVVGS